MTERILIVNADDFGRSPGINRGVIRAHEEGIVTSASLMVRWPAAGAAAEYARSRTKLGVGLHVDFSEWEFAQGQWRPVYEVVTADPVAIEEEVARQLERFRELVGRDPTHLDSHQHVHRRDPFEPVLVAVADALGVPLRERTDGIAYCGAFYGQTATGEPLPEAISTGRLVELIKQLPVGVTELACHPGEPEGGLDSVYERERALELSALCAADVRAALTRNKVVLATFATLPA